MSMITIERRLQELGGLHACLDPESRSSLWPLSDKEINELETTCGASLPPDYRQFLLNYGRSRFHGIVRPPSCGCYCIRWFYGGSANPDEIGNLKNAISVYQGRMPESLIPIAYCDDGEICLGISGAEREKVYYWDRWNEWDWQQQDRVAASESLTRAEEFQNVSELAPSFEGFISGLEIEQ